MDKSLKTNIINSCINQLKRKNRLTVLSLKFNLALNGIFLNVKEVKSILDANVSNGKLKFNGNRYY